MQVVLSKNTSKQYYRLPVSEQKKVKKKLLSLETSPLSGKKLSGELAAYRSLRAWPYRIIYVINDGKKRVEVSAIEHRQGVYK